MSTLVARALSKAVLITRTTSMASAFALASVAFSIGCSNASGSIDDYALAASATAPTTADAGTSTGDAGPKVALAERLFREMEPDLRAKCGGACHDQSTTEQAPPWLKPPAYDTIRAYPGIVIPDVYSSKILIKPNHLGISLQDKSLAGLRDKVVKWLTAEAEASNEKDLPATDPFPVVAGANSVDLSRAGKDIAGAKLTFDATIHQVDQSQILQLQNVAITAPATTDLKVTHPVFILVPNGDGSNGAKDPTDQFSTVDQTVPAGQTVALGPGAAMLVRFPQKGQLKIQFQKLQPPTAVGAGRACKNVAGFTANVVPAIQAQNCLSCHAGGDPDLGASAVNAVDMRKLGSNDTAACVQLLAKVNLGDRAKSSLILAPTSGNSLPHKGGKNIDPTSDFVTKMMAWIQSE